MSTMDPQGKLDALRESMRQLKIDAYVVPSEDAHASEYLAPIDARRSFLTGFTGSAGCAVITSSEALLWTDGRYWLQAGKQLASEWTLMKQGLPEIPTWPQWLKTELPKSSRIGIDPTVLPFGDVKTFTTSLETINATLVPVKENLIDAIWNDRPSRPSNEVFQLADQYTGQSVTEKIGLMREKLVKIGSPGIVVAQLDEVAWLFNLRGSDIPFNPVFFAYAILTPDDCSLFVQPQSLTQTVRDYLHASGVTILDYSQIWSRLENLGELVKAERERTAKEDVDMEAKPVRKAEAEKEKGEKVVKTDKVLVGLKTSWAVAKAIGEDSVEVRRSMIEEAKARKNATEIEGFRQCNIRDGAALCRYFAWLEEALKNGETWNEYDAAIKLKEYRSQNEKFMGLSFETISSTGANAAVIHYAPPETGSSTIDPNQIYLCDSGAQYLDGTTDTTRTWHFGTPSEEETRAFTRVLQGHISLDTVVFPQGTTGYVLDTLARRALWSDGLDYRHGTGHGVGHFLNVHEGPQGVGFRPAYNDIALQAGMTISNEPGYYCDGKFGIRIENVVVVKIAETRNNFGGKGYLEFEHFTTVPMQTKLVQAELLSPTERNWLNSYHNEVREKVEPVLRGFGDERALAWLERQCQSV